MWLKACPRCQGDLYPDADLSGAYLQCLQCGYTVYEPEQVLRRRRPRPPVRQPQAEKAAA